jgi:pimeloyl-ACP methyl ester carboxylesterase
VKQDVRFCTSSDGARLAYGVHGSGPPLVRVATWLTHLGFDWYSPVWRHWLDRLGEGHTVVRYDERGCGLSDASVGELSVDTWVADLETVVDAAGVDRFVLVGISQGAAIAIVYAARHPERVSDLVVYGGYLRGRQHRGQQHEEQALLAAIVAGWATPHPAFRRMFSMLFLPNGTAEQMAWFEDLLRNTTSGDNAARLFAARGDIDVTGFAPQVSTDAGHARPRRSRRTRRGGHTARRAHTGARLSLLDSDNHILLAGELRGSSSRPSSAHSSATAPRPDRLSTWPI